MRFENGFEFLKNLVRLREIHFRRNWYNLPVPKKRTTLEADVWRYISPLLWQSMKLNKCGTMSSQRAGTRRIYPSKFWVDSTLFRFLDIVYILFLIEIFFRKAGATKISTQLLAVEHSSNSRRMSFFSRKYKYKNFWFPSEILTKNYWLSYFILVHILLSWKKMTTN